MRREEIERLPDAIPLSAAQDMLRGLGLEPNDVLAVHMYPRHIEVEICATDDKGRKFIDENHEAARHLISFKVEYDK